jgi:hypothetical protein
MSIQTAHENGVKRRRAQVFSPVLCSLNEIRMSEKKREKMNGKLQKKKILRPV